MMQLTFIHLKGTMTSINDWMSANFFSLNPDKTEFLLIGHPKQLSKLDHPTLSLPDNVTLSPAKSAHNLGVIFDSNLSFTDHISAISKDLVNGMTKTLFQILMLDWINIQ